jgi:acyl carrier protein
MNDEEIKERVLEIVAREVRLERANLSLDSKLEELNIGSLDLVQIVFGIEEAFDIYVPLYDQSFKIETLSDVVEGIKRLVAEKKAA